MIILTDGNFKTEVESFPGVALVDFWAAWCAPCRIQGPIVEELASELANENIKIAKLNVDENRAVTDQFQVRSIPTLVLFKAGRQVNQLVGVQTKETLKRQLETLIS
jgi:thioredoxin 1